MPSLFEMSKGGIFSVNYCQLVDVEVEGVALKVAVNWSLLVPLLIMFL